MMIAVENKPARKVWTDHEIMSLPENGYSYEVVDGQLVMSPKNNLQHGDLCAEILMRMRMHAKGHKLGRVFDSNTGYWMINRNLRAPDVSFVSVDRLPKKATKEFMSGAPDLVVEVLSPTNRRDEMDKRLRDFFTSGTKLVWIIDPEEKFAEVCRSLTDRKIVGPGGILQGEELLPGFELPLTELFEDWK
jgi:Uma2 family endonuclease